MELPEIVERNEPITRYLFKGDFNINTKNIKSPVFSPKNDSLSVYRIQDCSEEKIWSIGKVYVAAKRPDGKVLQARADLISDDFFELKLNIKPSVEIHKRHADVINWPPDDDKVLMIKTELRSKAKLISMPA